MGTRSLTHIYDTDWDQTRLLCTIYRQFDGYPTGMGQDLKDFLTPFNVVNGLRLADDSKTANGAGCLTAQLIAAFKTEPGNVYIYPPGSTDCGEEYVYSIYAKAGEPVRIKVEDTYQSGHVLYDGPVSDFDPEKAEAA